MKGQLISDWQTAPLWQKMGLGFISLVLVFLLFKEPLLIKPYQKIKGVQTKYQNYTQQIKTAKLLLADEKVVAENLTKTQKIFDAQIPTPKEVGPWLNQLSQGLVKLELVQPLPAEIKQENAVFIQSAYRIELSGSLTAFQQFLSKMLASHFHPELKKLELRQSSGKGQYQMGLELSVITANKPTRAVLFPKQNVIPKAEQNLNPVLQGFWNGESPKALINGQLVGIGDYVGKHHVLQIKPNEKFVILEKDSKTIRLQL